MLHRIFHSLVALVLFVPDKSQAQIYMTYRTQVPAFYQELKQNWSKLKTLNQISSLGFCAGDAHPANFGFTLLHNNEVTVTYNDYDDSGICPLISDLLRFMLGSKYLLHDFGYKDISLSDLFNTYLKALKGHPVKLSKDLIRYLNKESPKYFLPSQNQIHGHHLVLKDDMQVVTNIAFLKQMKESMLQEFTELSDYQMTDLVSRTKSVGGSRGQTRYLSLWINLQNQSPWY